MQSSAPHPLPYTPKLNFQVFHTMLPISLLKDFIISRHKPTFSGIPKQKGVEFVPQKNKVIGFMVTKGVWYKLRVIEYEWLSCTLHDESGIYYLTQKAVDQDSVKLLQEIDRIFTLEKVTEQIESRKQSLKIKMEQSLEIVNGVCSNQKIRAYREIKNDISRGLKVLEVLLNQVVNFTNQEFYELQLQVELFGKEYILRVGTKERMYCLDVVLSATDRLAPLRQDILCQSFRQIIDQKDEILFADRQFPALEKAMMEHGFVMTSCTFDNHSKKFKSIFMKTLSVNKKLEAILSLKKRILYVEILEGTPGNFKIITQDQIDLKDSSAIAFFSQHLARIGSIANNCAQAQPALKEEKRRDGELSYSEHSESKIQNQKQKAQKSKGILELAEIAKTESKVKQEHYELKSQEIVDSQKDSIVKSSSASNQRSFGNISASAVTSEVEVNHRKGSQEENILKSDQFEGQSNRAASQHSQSFSSATMPLSSQSNSDAPVHSVPETPDSIAHPKPLQNVFPQIDLRGRVESMDNSQEPNYQSSMTSPTTDAFGSPLQVPQSSFMTDQKLVLPESPHDFTVLQDD